MNHPNRGMAIIFNHEHFVLPNLDRRSGTNVDCENLQKTLTHLHFNVKVYQDLKLDKIIKKLNKIANLNHSKNDCLLIAILSHGKYGVINAYDYEYSLDTILNYFTVSRCPTLAGKPKLFFIQACQGDRLDDGITLHSRTTEIDHDDESSMLRSFIPTDFLISYSTIPGYRAWRSSTNGSWFIQSLCKELWNNGKRYDILTLLTFVCQSVAFQYESNCIDTKLNRKKEIPCISSVLTKLLYFNDKECG